MVPRRFYKYPNEVGDAGAGAKFFVGSHGLSQRQKGEQVF
jgi:hypothetical protein